MLAENSAWVGGALRQRSRNSSYCRRSIRWICAYKCSSLGDPAHSWMVPTKSQKQGGLGQFLQGYRLKRQQEDLSRLKMAVKNRKEKKKSKTHQQWTSWEGVKQLDEEFQRPQLNWGFRRRKWGRFLWRNPQISCIKRSQNRKKGELTEWVKDAEEAAKNTCGSQLSLKVDFYLGRRKAGKNVAWGQ